MKVSKEVTFDCSHMLSGHDGLCQNLHGHTYKVVVSVSGTQLTEGSSKNMVIDFKHLKRAITTVITERFDHGIIFSDYAYRNVAECALYTWALQYNMKYFVMPERSTAEDMAKFFKDEIFKYLTEELNLQNITDVEVRVYETPTSYAEV